MRILVLGNVCCSKCKLISLNCRKNSFVLTCFRIFANKMLKYERQTFDIGFK